MIPMHHVMLTDWNLHMKCNNHTCIKSLQYVHIEYMIHIVLCIKETCLQRSQRLTSLSANFSLNAEEIWSVAQRGRERQRERKRKSSGMPGVELDLQLAWFPPP